MAENERIGSSFYVKKISLSLKKEIVNHLITLLYCPYKSCTVAGSSTAFNASIAISTINANASPADTFSILVKQYKEKLYWYVRKIVIDHNDASDVTQNAFIKAWQNMDAFKNESDIYTWLYRIATNEAINHLRKKSRYSFFAPGHMAKYLTQTLDTATHISGDEIQLRLHKAVATLPQKQRIIFILRYFEDKSYAEIAGITGSAQGTLHATYHIAVKKIEEILRSH